MKAHTGEYYWEEIDVIAFEKILRINLGCKLVPVLFREKQTNSMLGNHEYSDC